MISPVRYVSILIQSPSSPLSLEKKKRRGNIIHGSSLTCTHAHVRINNVPQDSFTRAKNWVAELQRQGNPDLIMALAGNKADLQDQRKVSAETGKSYSQEMGLFFMETSAKASTNVNELFYEIGEILRMYVYAY